MMKNEKSVVVTMGTFDGIHLGHQKLLSVLNAEAKKIDGISTVLTYYHHPLETLHKLVEPYLLTEKFNKEYFLKKFGVEEVIFLEFDKTFAEMDPKEFIKNILVDRVKAKIIVVGYDTHFGKNRSGNYELLKKYESEFGYKVIQVEPYYFDDKIVTSSSIRDLVRKGNIEQVNRLQGHLFSVFGKVTHGNRIGHQLGFPTVNIKPKDKNKLYPNCGIYLSLIKIEGKKYFGMTNVGISPTIKTTNIIDIESHIFDFNHQIYEKYVCIIFLKRIRDEKKFETKEKLIHQITQDVQIGRKLAAEKFQHLLKIDDLV